MKNLHVYILALALTVTGLGLAAYKTRHLGIPLKPAEQTEVWTVEANISFEANNRAAKLSFLIPRDPDGYSLLDEDFVSSSYGLATQDDGINREVQWAIRKAKGKQNLYYRILLYEDESSNAHKSSAKADFPRVPDYPEPRKSAINTLLQDVRNASADILTFSRELILQFNDESPNENVRLLKIPDQSRIGRVRTLIEVLAGARIPARVIYILELKDGLRHGNLEPWLEVHNGNEWVILNPVTAELKLPKNSLIWQVGDDPLVHVEGGGPADVDFSVASSSQDLLSIAEHRATQLNSNVMAFSLFSIPIETQNTYRILLMVPLGAFLVVMIRNFIGFKTFGTFMPILMALSFRETELLWGIILFTLLVSLGLMVRFYLETLKLLLVPRLASVLTIVILLMAGVSVISHKLGIDRGLSIALFPMVILAMTIEKMSLVWEESGPSEAIQQGLGSLFVASLGYLVMTNTLLEHLAFVFPELLLVILAMTLLMGRYTGYRISELWRFRTALLEKGN